jgi:hypothetical protein
MTRKHWVSIGAAGVLLVAAGVVAWSFWPVALRYREDRAFSVARSGVADYLAGKDSLTPAACRLAGDLVRWQELSVRVQLAQPASIRRLVDPVPALVPPGTDPEDPRVLELMVNASRFAFSKDLPDQLRDGPIQVMDSIIRARGFRRVQCGAA